MRRGPCAVTAAKAPQPPSVVAEPPQPMTMRRAPASRAARRSWPTPVGVGVDGVLVLGVGDEGAAGGLGHLDDGGERLVAASAVGAAGPGGVSVRRRHSASTGWPRGPGTVVWRDAPPSASSRPSPPSDIGTSSAVQPARRAAAAAAAAASPAEAVPRNLSGATTRCGTVRARGLEPPPPFGDRDLNPARLPIPPRPQRSRSAGDQGVYGSVPTDAPSGN